MKRSKPYMGSGPEVEEPEMIDVDVHGKLLNQICELKQDLHAMKAENKRLFQLCHTQQVIIHELQMNQDQDEEEPQEKRCL